MSTSSAFVTTAFFRSATIVLAKRAIDTWELVAAIAGLCPKL